MKIGLIDELGKFLGQFDFEYAKKMASTRGKDLVLLNIKTNTYKIADAGKSKYEQKQKEKQERVQKKSNKIKEIKMRPAIDRHDLEVKIKSIREFLLRGLKTKVVMIFRGRQITHKDLAIEKFNEIPNQLVNEGIAVLESPPKFNGRELTALLIPVQK